MYAGYINVDKTNNRNLYYWFVESQGSPATDPVILWLNGGGRWLSLA
jgi:serine carboxypeptidase-like clade 1